MVGRGQGVEAFAPPSRQNLLAFAVVSASQVGVMHRWFDGLLGSVLPQPLLDSQSAQPLPSVITLGELISVSQLPGYNYIVLSGIVRVK